MSYAEELNWMVQSYGHYASEDDLALWSLMDMGTTMNAITEDYYYQWV